MANLSVIGGHSVNGVAKLHTEILKNTVLRDFYAISPEKFNNKTNGVSHRRFLLQSNPGLSRYIAERVGDGWVEQPEKLEGLLAYTDDTESLRELAKVKLAAKKEPLRLYRARLRHCVQPGRRHRRAGQAHPRLQASAPERL